MEYRAELLTLKLERALQFAAVCHRGQFRKGGEIPYVEHVVGVAWILDRLGFDEDVVVAGLLHDVVEDTDTSLDDVRARFGEAVARTVDSCSEVKLGADGRKRPWIDRKRDYLAALAEAPASVRAVALADKLHNLLSIASDLGEGRPVWAVFNAGRADVLWYYRTAVERLGSGEPRLEILAAQCRRVLAEIEMFDSPRADDPTASPPDET